jgi:hypothetical protein
MESKAQITESDVALDMQRNHISVARALVDAQNEAAAFLEQSAPKSSTCAKFRSEAAAVQWLCERVEAQELERSTLSARLALLDAQLEALQMALDRALVEIEGAEGARCMDSVLAWAAGGH